MAPTVLIVDDHRVFRTTACALLQADGFRVLAAAADAGEGLRAARELRPDLVLLDVRLPDVDGFAVATELSREPGGPAIVMTSSAEDPLYPGEAVRCGAVGFVPKHDVCGASLRELLGDRPPAVGG